MARDSIIALLQRLAEVLATSEPTWSRHMTMLAKRVAATTQDEYSACLIEIASLFAGMGSLSDLVLQREGQALMDDSTKLDVLRRELFAAVRDELGSL